MRCTGRFAHTGHVGRVAVLPRPENPLSHAVTADVIVQADAETSYLASPIPCYEALAARLRKCLHLSDQEGEHKTDLKEEERGLERRTVLNGA